MKKIYFILFTTLCTLSASCLILPVPATYSSIQAAINAASNGDTVAVAPGTYYENINFRGKNIVVTSHYYLNNDVNFISSTIINGSNPVHADTASCVIFDGNESAAAVLQGFTITGGKGTKWLDAHGAGTFREGGGILIEYASPTIRHNLITANTVTNTSGVVSTGGGGIRIGDGNPVICSNAITFNQASYGAGVVLNYTAGKITNNVIASNSGGQQYNGGSGIWAIEESTLGAIYIENNTIANNSAPNAGGTGGLYISGTNSASVRNNIIYSNWPALQVKIITSTATVTYNDIQGGYTGTTNINVNPLLAANNYSLGISSPCIDAGDPSALYNDLANPSSPSTALLPSLGGLLNDMGAYGGPCAAELPLFATITNIEENIKDETLAMLSPNPAGNNTSLKITLKEAQDQADISVIDISGRILLKQTVNYLNSGINTVEINTIDLPSGIYTLKIEGQNRFHQSVKLIIVK